MERQRDREEKEEEEEEEEEWKRGGERCSIDAGSFGGALLQSACVHACVCLRVCYVPMSRDFQTSVEPESIPLQRKQAPPTLVPELQRG